MATTKWVLDPMHSEVQFKVKHLVISTVSGFFRSFEGSVETDGDNFEHAKIDFSIDINSVDTNQTQRDEHLKSAEFFDAAATAQGQPGAREVSAPSAARRSSLLALHSPKAQVAVLALHEEAEVPEKRVKIEALRKVYDAGKIADELND